MPEFFVSGYLRNRKTGMLKMALFYPFNDIYAGTFTISDHDPLGKWDVLAVIQNVNNADPRGSPQEKAAILGGLIYSRNFEFKRDAESGNCVLNPNWDLTVHLT